MGRFPEAPRTTQLETVMAATQLDAQDIISYGDREDTSPCNIRIEELLAPEDQQGILGSGYRTMARGRVEDGLHGRDRREWGGGLGGLQRAEKGRRASTPLRELPGNKGHSARRGATSHSPSPHTGRVPHIADPLGLQGSDLYHSQPGDRNPSFQRHRETHQESPVHQALPTQRHGTSLGQRTHRHRRQHQGRRTSPTPQLQRPPRPHHPHGHPSRDLRSRQSSQGSAQNGTKVRPE